MALTTGVATDLLTFARSGTKKRFSSAGLMLDVADGVIALEHDPATVDPDEPSFKKRLGALIEGAATPILTFTEAFNDLSWTKLACTVDEDQAVAPDGTTTMDKIVENSGAGLTPAVYKVLATPTNGAPYWYSVFAKKGERHRLNLFNNGGYSVNATFDLDAGTVESLTDGDAAVIIDCGDGIYRCAAYDVASSTSNGNMQHRVFPDAGGHPYTGDGTSGLYVWGGMMVQDACLTSYVPRTGSGAASRNADTLTLPVASVTPWSDTQGTIEISAKAPYGLGTRVLFQIDDGSENNRIRITRNASRNLLCIVTAGGVEQCSLNLGSVADGTEFSVAFAWATDDFAASLDGAAAVTDTSGSVPTVTTMRFGQSFTGEHWNATIKTVLHTVP